MKLKRKNSKKIPLGFIAAIVYYSICSYFDFEILSIILGSILILGIILIFSYIIVKELKDQNRPDPVYINEFYKRIQERYDEIIKSENKTEYENIRTLRILSFKNPRGFLGDYVYHDIDEDNEQLHSILNLLEYNLDDEEQHEFLENLIREEKIQKKYM